MAEKIQEINRETQQLKAKIQTMGEICSNETAKAQVRAHNTLLLFHCWFTPGVTC